MQLLPATYAAIVDDDLGNLNYKGKDPDVM